MKRVAAVSLVLVVSACIPEECPQHDQDFAKPVVDPGAPTALQPGETRRVRMVAANDANRTGIHVEPGVPHRLTVVDGRVCDQQYPSGPEGIASPNPILSAAESMRKEPGANWMEVVANVGGTQFKIGAGPTDITPGGSGELLLFANDVPGYYDNNHGGFLVDVTRP